MKTRHHPKVRDAYMGTDWFTSVPYLQCPVDGCVFRAPGLRLVTARRGLRTHLKEVHCDGTVTPTH